MKYGTFFKLTASIAMILALTGAFPALADTVYVNASLLNLRGGPSTDNEILDVIARGTKLEREGEVDGWSIVTANGKKGYVSSQYLSPAEPAGDNGSAAVSSPYADRTWQVTLNEDYPYASFAKITDGAAIYYHNGGKARNGRTVCVNAGHGTKGGSSVKTLCHPDGSAKITGGSTAAGATTAAAVSSGMVFADGTAESEVTLKLAKILREKLLEAGYDVLMIREGSDVRLDNVARTVIANNNADCHIALHWDSTERDKGAFYMSVPDSKTYRAMEPVASHWQEHHALGDALISGLKDAGVKIFSSGSMGMDLTQTSYSTIPSVDIELGDKISPHTDEALEKLADGLLSGIGLFFGQAR